MKVIAFSLFGSAERYRTGLLRNLEIAPTVFPGWTCMVYCDEINFIALKDVQLPHAHILLQAKESHGVAGMTWRWNACRIQGASAVIFRDTDSILGAREKKVVDEWLASRQDVHLIRDHPAHTSAVMGGMFGVKGLALKLLAQMVDRFHSDHRQHEYGDDQAFLNQHFYPKVKHRAMVHTSSVRYLFEYALALPPCQDGELFIGAYEFATNEEQARYVEDRRNTPMKTLLPYAWKETRILKVLFKRIQFHHIRFGCLWCI